jgi:amino-acid N-acetyltransferase
MRPRIEKAELADGPAIVQLLTANALPVDGVLEHLQTALVARTEGRVVGSAALEVYPEGALLRSVVVDASARGNGIGQQLTRSALELADSLGMPAVYLLTTTAEGFFPQFAFRRITREQVPPSVQKSAEFVSACPSSAIVMKRAF